MRVRLAPDADDELVIRDVEPLLFTPLIRLRYFDELVREVDVLSPGADVVSRGARQDATDGLNKRPQFERADRGRGQHRREKEVVGGRHDGDVVVARIEILQHGDRSPAAAENNEARLAFECPALLGVIVIDVVLNYGQVLRAAALRIQSQQGDTDVAARRVLFVRGRVVDEEGDDADSEDEDKAAEEQGGFV